MQIAFHSPAVPAPIPAAASPQPASKPAPSGTFAQALAEASREGAEPPASKPSLKSQGIPPLFKYADDGVITGDEMRMALGEAKAEYQNRLTSAFVARDIDTSVPLRLQVDTAGRVIVAGDHPDKARIEAIFAEDAQLANAFKKTLSLANMLERGEEAMAFQAAYAKDPKAAVARYSHLFTTSVQLTMTHRWGSDGLDVSFESERVPRSAWG